jgi:hypothetical protein
MANQIVNNTQSTFSPFQSSGGIVRSCNDYYSLVQKAGSNNLEKDNMGITYQTAFGGKGKKSKKTSVVKKSKKPVKSSSSKAKKSKKPKKTIVNKAMSGVKKIKNMIMSKVSSMKKKKSKKQKGGQESSGATPMDMRFFNTNASLLNSSANSGMGVNSAYGSIDPKDVGVGMLAPYTTSTCKTANHSSGQQTGGKKSKAKKSKVKKTKKEKSMMNKIMKKMSNIKKSILPGDKKKKSGKKSKKQRGGENDELPGYDCNDKLAIYDENNKQKGGKKGDLMQKMSPTPIIKSQELTTGMIDGAIGILNTIVKGYNKSLKEAENIKIGNQRLIQGGSKSSSKKSKKPKKSSVVKKTKKTKKSSSKKPKKTVTKKPKKTVTKKTKKTSSKKRPKKHKGGDGSDFALTLGSRGNASAPDKFWGVDGETWFRQFNKTGQYIPNSRLAEAATPLLLSGPQNNTVMGYDDMGIGCPYGKP